ncbi:MAG TPA: metal-dependent phosphohydrolase [Alphaproteobacteria bacterium]|nr:metal-dependent phosphohydrolase [Alphaproteobacteria bacterium]HAJ47132.1 metal-dependent phosphohydrolase [Alphaproteobacteria bacterium]
MRHLTPLWRGHVNALSCFDAKRSQEIFVALCQSYSEPHRAYHTLDHLVDLFSRLEQHAVATADPLRLAFAAWYHDIVYDPRAVDNEERSSERALQDLRELGATHDFTSRVCRLILATKNHQKGGADADDDLFLDCDYAILGAAPDTYRTYAANVRQEYAHRTDGEWRGRRGAFLERAIAGARIFRTQQFEELYGDAARQNMRAELDRLRSQTHAQAH